jgi:hypothetical protein
MSRIVRIMMLGNELMLTPAPHLRHGMDGRSHVVNETTEASATALGE